MLGGVSAGIADYFDVDPTIVRLAWVITVFIGGTGLLVYLLAWLIIPVEPESSAYVHDAGGSLAHAASEATATEGKDPTAERSAPSLELSGAAEGSLAPSPTARPAISRGIGGGEVIGATLVIIGSLWLARNFFPHLGLHRYWPVALVFIGLYMVLTAFTRD